MKHTIHKWESNILSIQLQTPVINVVTHGNLMELLVQSQACHTHCHTCLIQYPHHT